MEAQRSCTACSCVGSAYWQMCADLPAAAVRTHLEVGGAVLGEVQGAQHGAAVDEGQHHNGGNGAGGADEDVPRWVHTGVEVAGAVGHKARAALGHSVQQQRVGQRQLCDVHVVGWRA
jgi:hypothetical protein